MKQKVNDIFINNIMCVKCELMDSFKVKLHLVQCTVYAWFSKCKSIDVCDTGIILFTSSYLLRLLDFDFDFEIE